MNDRNFYERRLGNPGYDAVARKKIKELEKAVGGGSGGGGIFVIKAFVDFDESAGEFKALMVDKSIDEIAAACEAGKIVVMEYNGREILYTSNISRDWETGAFIEVGFASCKYTGEGNFQCQTIDISSDGNVKMWSGRASNFDSSYDAITVPITQLPPELA